MLTGFDDQVQCAHCGAFFVAYHRCDPPPRDSGTIPWVMPTKRVTREELERMYQPKENPANAG